MAELISLEEIQEKVILIGVATSDSEDVYASLEELSELVKTAGALTVGKIIQNREKIHPGTYIGSGKIEEVKDLIFSREATGVVCDDELSPAQLRNLEDALDTKVMDRTMVILDIFAKRASTAEGKIQVELAQLRYSASRLVGLRSSLSRLGGGIGTRGPGEKKIEMDRRLIHDRISQLRAELLKVQSHRERIRESRKVGSFVAALVGYTNVGKSTLLNALTGSDILAEDKLFATLDPTTRRLSLASGQEMMLTDTVGFIRKLPHHLIEAFKSTLEEAKYADLIIHVVDASSLDAESQMLVVYDTLRGLGVEDVEILTVYNKIDQMEEFMDFPRDFHADASIKVSAKTGAGLEELKLLLEQIMRKRKILLEKVFGYQELGKIQQIRKYGELLEEEYTDAGVRVKAYVLSKDYAKLVSE